MNPGAGCRSARYPRRAVGLVAFRYGGSGRVPSTPRRSKRANSLGGGARPDGPQERPRPPERSGEKGTRRNAAESRRTSLRLLREVHRHSVCEGRLLARHRELVPQSAILPLDGLPQSANARLVAVRLLPGLGAQLGGPQLQLAPDVRQTAASGSPLGRQSDRFRLERLTELAPPPPRGGPGRPLDMMRYVRPEVRPREASKGSRGAR